MARTTVIYRIQKGLDLVGKALRRKGITVASVGLAALFAANLCEAAEIPGSLAVALGKLKIAQSVHAVAAGSSSVGSSAALLGGALVMKKAVIGIAVLLAVGCGLWALWPGGAEKPEETITAVAGPEEPGDAPDVAAAPVEMVVPAEEAAEAEAGSEEEPNPAPVVAAAEVDPAKVSGQVKTSEGYPVEGATVVLDIGRDGEINDLAGSYAVETSADGRYEITGIQVFGRAYGFASGEGYVMQRRTGLKVLPGAHLDGVDFELEAGVYFIAGQVLSVARQPVPGAMLDVMYCGYDEEGLADTAATGRTTGWIGGAKLLFAVSDERGYFRIAIPYEGLCDFRVTKEGYGAGLFARIPTGTYDARFILRSGGGASPGRYLMGTVSPWTAPGCGWPERRCRAGWSLRR